MSCTQMQRWGEVENEEEVDKGDLDKLNKYDQYRQTRDNTAWEEGGGGG